MISRIKQLLDWQQLSPTQFADRIGIGRPVISHILSERNKPSLEVVRSIKAAFPEVSTDWLLEGIGEMLATTAALVAAPTPAPPAPAPVPPVAAAAPVPPTSAPVAAPRPAITRFAAGKLKTDVASAPPAPLPAPPAEVPTPVAPMPVTPPLPLPAALPLPAVAEAPPLSAAAPAPTASTLADVLGESGKAIRRIVIFYRDGSFADYQPEG